MPDGWQQGAGAYGGLSFGWIARACASAVDDPHRRLRSLSVQLCAPVLPGVAVIEVERLRDGGAVSHLAARLVQDGATRALGVATLGIARTDRAWLDPTRPAAGDWRSITPVPMDAASFGGRSPFPPFASQFEYRFALGSPPWSGASAGYSGGWVRPCDPGAHRDDAVVAALIDTWWPAALVRETGPRPMATISALIQWLADGGAPDEPLLHTVRSDAATDGYTVEDRELWREDGALVAVCRQTLAVL